MSPVLKATTTSFTLGDKAFFEKYHFDGGIIADKTICKIYKLKARKDDE